MGWWTRTKARAKAVLSPLAAPSPRSGGPPPTVPVYPDPAWRWHGTVPVERVRDFERRLQANAERQRREALAEQEALRQATEQAQRELARQPLGARFPDAQPSPWLTGDAVLDRLMNPNPWRR